MFAINKCINNIYLIQCIYKMLLNPVPRLWIRSAEERGERRYENRNTTSNVAKTLLVLSSSTLQNGNMKKRNAFHFIKFYSHLFLYVFFFCLYISNLIYSEK